MNNKRTSFPHLGNTMNNIRFSRKIELAWNDLATAVMDRNLDEVFRLVKYLLVLRRKANEADLPTINLP